MKKTPLYEEHLKLKAKIIDFGGWLMPVQYTNVIDEHLTTRTKVGLFDISHMGEIIVSGADALEYLQLIATNDIEKIIAGKSAYSIMCYENGTTVDDIFVYCFNDDSYLIVVNAGTTENDLLWLRKHALSFDVDIDDKTDFYAMISIQGAYAEKTLQKLTNYYLGAIKRFEFIEDYLLRDIKAIISRTGYTGEDGFEIFFDSKYSKRIWNELLSAGKEYGIKPIGLGARDTLRLEACYSLYGHELSSDITPLEADVGFVVKLNKDNFIGKKELLKQRHEGIKRKIIGFEMLDNSIPRNGYEIFHQNTKIGYVTSGTFSPTFKKGIGLAMIDIPYVEIGTKINIMIRATLHSAIIVKKPFYVYSGRTNR